jgi:protein-disulfide isomerase
MDGRALLLCYTKGSFLFPSFSHMDTPSTQSNNPWFVVSVGLMGLILGYGLSSAVNSFGPGNTSAQVAQVAEQPTDNPPPEAPPAGDVPEVDVDSDHLRGNPDAPITIVEYSDFECPFCKRHHPTMVQVMSEYGDKVNWVYRHFPLSFHPQAMPSAEASECAAELGGNEVFWKYADALMAGELSTERYVTLAKEQGLSEAQFNDCLESDRHVQKINDQMNGGSSAGVSGTPGNFVINNDSGEAKSVEGAVPFATFKSTIDAMLAAE